MIAGPTSNQESLAFQQQLTNDGRGSIMKKQRSTEPKQAQVRFSGNFMTSTQSFISHLSVESLELEETKQMSINLKLQKGLGLSQFKLKVMHQKQTLEKARSSHQLMRSDNILKNRINNQTVQSMQNKNQSRHDVFEFQGSEAILQNDQHIKPNQRGSFQLKRISEKKKQRVYIRKSQNLDVFKSEDLLPPLTLNRNTKNENSCSRNKVRAVVGFRKAEDQYSSLQLNQEIKGTISENKSELTSINSENNNEILPQLTQLNKEVKLSHKIRLPKKIKTQELTTPQKNQNYNNASPLMSQSFAKQELIYTPDIQNESEELEAVALRNRYRRMLKVRMLKKQQQIEERQKKSKPCTVQECLEELKKETFFAASETKIQQPSFRKNLDFQKLLLTTVEIKSQNDQTSDFPVLKDQKKEVRIRKKHQESSDLDIIKEQPFCEPIFNILIKTDSLSPLNKRPNSQISYFEQINPQIQRPERVKRQYQRVIESDQKHNNYLLDKLKQRSKPIKESQQDQELFRQRKELDLRSSNQFGMTQLLSLPPLTPKIGKKLCKN